jgi:hypothetical protein
MWGTSSPDDKLTGGLGNEIEATQIGGCRSDCPMAGKVSPGNFGLLQQYLPILLQKSFSTADQNFSRPLVRFSDKYVRDLVSQ